MTIPNSTVSSFTAASVAAPIPTYIPGDIAGLPQFVVWKLEPRIPKPSKVPHNPHTGLRASVVNPNHWSELGTALTALQAGCYNGVGFVFTAQDDFAGVDLDGCRDPQTGALESWASDILRDFDSYAEVSPSGTGVKVWIRGAVPGGGRRRGAIEAYSARRFFTLTGQRLHDAPTEIKPCQSALDKLQAHFGETSVPTQPVLSSAAGTAGFAAVAGVENTVGVGQAELAAILKKARNAANGDRFSRLYDRGDLSEFDSDWSRADFQLCLYLSYWTNGDLAAMDILFRRSSLMREKWDTVRGDSTYGEVTLRLAARSR
jgi:putative DNA primase/helicase